MGILKKILPILACLPLAGCQDEYSSLTPDKTEDNSKISIDISLDMARIETARTRTFSDKPVYGDLKLYVLEFELNGEDPFDNNITRNYGEARAITEETVNDDGDVHFKLTLEKEDQPRVLHFIAVPKDVEFNINAFNEGTLIPSLSVDGEKPAYWNRIEFPRGYGSYNSAGTWVDDPNLKSTLTHVPMLCNFAKISLSIAAGTGLTLDGFALINQPMKGSVAPWNSTAMRFPDFLNGSKLNQYKDISASYDGYWPFNQVNDVTVKSPSDDLFTTDAKYLYEHPHTSLYSPLIILKGHRGTGSPMYYKLDLGKPDDQKLFQFYNILRNFEYAITVTKIDADGYATAQDALNGVVYNNFSFDVNTRNMLNVSDGTNMLWVNQATFVVTNASETVIQFKYRYKKEIGTNGGTVSNGTGESDDLAFKDLKTGEAITGITYGTTDDADGWRTVTITTVDPSSTRRSQDFIIYDKNTGLGRTIRIIVRNPWNYSNYSLYGVNYDTYPQYQTAVADYSQWHNVVSSATASGSSIGGQPLTIGFEIENDIPEAMFPLEFVYEAKPQNIENNYNGNLPVRTGVSLFSEVTSRTIKYVKTVTWLDYNTELNADNPTATLVKREDGTEFHFVRARFLTSASISGTENIVRVYNPYMRVRTGEEPNVAYNQYLDFTYGVSSNAGPNLAN